MQLAPGLRLKRFPKSLLPHPSFLNALHKSTCLTLAWPFSKGAQCGIRRERRPRFASRKSSCGERVTKLQEALTRKFFLESHALWSVQRLSNAASQLRKKSFPEARGNLWFYILGNQGERHPTKVQNSAPRDRALIVLPMVSEDSIYSIQR